MNFKEFLNEGKQVGIVYHYTTPGRLLQILRSNQLKKGNFPVGSDLNVKGISTTRDKRFHVGTNRETIGGIECRLVLNGDTISNIRKIKHYGAKEGVDRDEQEEFIHGDVPNLNKYIISVDINIVKMKSKENWQEYLNEIKKECEKLHLKLRYI